MRLLLFILCIAEVMLYTYGQELTGVFIHPVLMLVVSFAIAFLFLHLSNKPTAAGKEYSRRTRTLAKVASVVIFASLSAWVIALFDEGIRRVPLLANYISDVMLTYVHIVKNFTAGKPAYEAFLNINYVITPSYLPFQWLPCVIAEYLDFDYRWMAVSLMLLVSGIFLAKNLRGKVSANLFWNILIPVWPLVIYIISLTANSTEFMISLESIAAAYYLLLSVAIDKNKVVLMATGLALCLLSRMSIAWWVPLCVVCFFIYGERKKALMITGICLLFVLLFYLPFALNNPGLFSNPYGSYSKAIEGIWEYHHGMNGLSFNAWGMSFLGGDAHHKVLVYNKIHLAVCSLSVLAFGLYSFRGRKKYTLNSYLLFSLKIYLTLFYTFVQLAFIYLYIVPLIITAALLSHIFLQKQVMPMEPTPSDRSYKEYY